VSKSDQSRLIVLFRTRPRPIRLAPGPFEAPFTPEDPQSDRLAWDHEHYDHTHDLDMAAHLRGFQAHAVFCIESTANFLVSDRCYALAPSPAPT